MGNGNIGGDPEEMRRMARMFNDNAGKLDGIVKDLNSRTVDSESIWRGPAADRFRGEWDQARGSFEKMVQALEQASTAVKQNAAAIERVMS
jgi:WXG100 family type VII secretion target